MLATRLLLQCRGCEWRNWTLLARALAALDNDGIGAVQPGDGGGGNLWIELKDLALLTDKGGRNDQVGNACGGNPNLNGGVVAGYERANGSFALNHQAEGH